MKKFVEGDNLTLEDVRTALKEAHNRNIKHTIVESIDIQTHLSKDGYYEFDSWDDYRKAFGAVPLEEAFKW